MKIVLSDEAMNWFKVEMDIVSGEAVRFFARYGGASPLHESFSLGVTKEQPDEAVVQLEIEGTLFYIERRDKWFFVEHDLHVNVNEENQELVYSYEKA